MTTAPTVWSLLRDCRGFRLLWAGTVVSFLGDWLTTVAVLTLIEEFSTASIWVSLSLIAKTLPIFLIVPFAGPLADRIDRRQILIVTDLVRVALVQGMIIAYWLGSLHGVLVLLTLRSFVGGCFIPARTAAIPDLVRSDRFLPAAMSIMGATWSVMLALGAALGGLITAWLGVTGALVVDALTFLLSAAILWGLPELPPSERGDSHDTSFRAGLAYLKGRVYLTAVLLLKPSLFVSGAMLVLLPIFSNGLYFPGWRGPLWLGALYTARGLGAALGSLGLRRWIGDAIPTLQRAILVGYLLIAVSYVAMAYSPSFALTALTVFTAMIGSGIIWPFAGTLGQLATERRVRGRLFALEFGVTMLSSSACFFLVGTALDFGVRPFDVMLVFSGLTLLPMLAWAAVLRWAPDLPA